MTIPIQYRRGTTTQHSTFTGLLGEMTVDTTKDVLVVHDGSTAGGFPQAREDLSNVTTANARSKIGATTVGTSLITAADAAAGRTAIGAAGGSLLAADGAAGTNRGLRITTAGSLRWDVLADTVAEGGANAGSNFAIARYTDAGALIGVALGINRATGAVFVTDNNHAIGIAGGNPYYQFDPNDFISFNRTTNAFSVTIGGTERLGIDASGNWFRNGVAANPAPVPQTTTGVGQWTAIASTTGGALTLPAGGTWAWMYLGRDTTNSTIAGAGTSSVSAGGTTIQSGVANVLWFGFAWRIA